MHPSPAAFRPRGSLHPDRVEAGASALSDDRPEHPPSRAGRPLLGGRWFPIATIAYLTGTTAEEIDEALTHAAASRRRALTRGSPAAIAALTAYLDHLLDQRLELAAGTAAPSPAPPRTSWHSVPA